MEQKEIRPECRDLFQGLVESQSKTSKTMALLEEMATEEEFRSLRAAILDWRSVING